ncbi:hypothetical protein B0H14DRAFT_3450804 [Mycena olivaceomarginata]|nr:hypothetical protein B0H14DRAFT_3450804 [Mycena olivaceomarginata]
MYEDHAILWRALTPLLPPCSKRAELKTRSLEEQELARQKCKAYQAKYREKNRDCLSTLYKERYGPEAYAIYLKARRQRRLKAAALRSGGTWDMWDIPYGYGYHPEENDGIVGMTPIPAKYMTKTRVV